MEGMGQHTANDKWDPSAPTAEERPRKSKQFSDPGISKVEAVKTVSHLMEGKLDISITVGVQHRWEFPVNYPVFTVLMVIYRYDGRIG